MNFAANDLLLSLADVFVILIPGCVLILCLVVIVGGWQLTNVPTVRSDLRGMTWIVVFVVTFVLGHFISQLGAFAEDWYYSANADDIVEEFPQLRSRSVTVARTAYGLEGVDSMNVRGWALRVLAERGSPAADRIGRRDAQRRLFRNLSIVFSLSLLVTVVSLLAGSRRAKGPRAILLAVLVFCVCMSLWRWGYEGRQYSRDVFEAFLVSASLADGCGEDSPN